MELGILNRIDQNLRRNNRQTPNINNSENEEEDFNNTFNNEYIEEEQKYYSVSTLDWLNAQVRI